MSVHIALTCWTRISAATLWESSLTRSSQVVNKYPSCMSVSIASLQKISIAYIAVVGEEGDIHDRLSLDSPTNRCRNLRDVHSFFRILSHHDLHDFSLHRGQSCPPLMVNCGIPVNSAGVVVVAYSRRWLTSLFCLAREPKMEEENVRHLDFGTVS